MAKELTILQKRYADIYFSMKEPNQTQAYIQAGYKARGKTAEANASRLLRNAKVEVYLNKLRTAITKKTQIDAAKVVTELGKVAFTNIKDYINIDEEGKLRFIPFDQIDDEKLAAIESFKVRVNVTRNRKDDKEYTTTTTEFKLHSKLNALEQLGKHFGIYEKDNDQSRTIELTKPLTLEEMKERILEAEKAGTGIDKRSIEGGKTS